MGQSNQLERMLKLMKLDETTNKQNTNSSLEYVTEGADGKMYAVVREGTKYFIKNSDIKGKNLVSEDFNYVGGFMEKKHCKFNSYADAIKNLDMKLMSIKESCNSTVQIVEATNPAFKAERKVRETESMGIEIARQRQIMERLEHLHEDTYMIKPKGEGFGGVGESNPFAKTKPEINKLQKEIGTEEEADETPLNDKGEPKAKAVGNAGYKEVEKKPKSIMQPVIPVKEGIEINELEQRVAYNAANSAMSRKGEDALTNIKRRDQVDKFSSYLSPEIKALQRDAGVRSIKLYRSQDGVNFYSVLVNSDYIDSGFISIEVFPNEYKFATGNASLVRSDKIRFLSQLIKKLQESMKSVKEGVEFSEEEVDLDEPNLDDEEVLDTEDEPQNEDELEQDLDLDSEPLEDETCDGCDTDELLRMVLDRLENIETELTQEKYSDEDLYDGDEEEIEGEEDAEFTDDEEEFEPQMSDVEPEPETIGVSDEQDVEPQEEKFLENRIMKALHSTLIKEGFYDDDDMEDDYVEMTDDDYRNLEIAKSDKNKISKFVDKDIEDEFKDVDADLEDTFEGPFADEAGDDSEFDV